MYAVGLDTTTHCCGPVHCPLSLLCTKDLTKLKIHFTYQENLTYVFIETL